MMTKLTMLRRYDWHGDSNNGHNDDDDDLAKDRLENCGRRLANANRDDEQQRQKDSNSIS